jgi:hypothetical protein
MVTTRSGSRRPPSDEIPFLNGHENGNGNDKPNGTSKKRLGSANGANGHSDEHDSKRQKVAEPVDKTRWRMKSDDGRHTWHYLEDDAAAKEWPQSYADKWYLGLPLVRLPVLPRFCLQHADLHGLCCRTSPPSSRPRPQSTRYATASPSSSTCNSRAAIGAASTAGPRSSCRAMPSLGTPRSNTYRRSIRRRSRTTSLLAHTLKMGVGGYTSRASPRFWAPPSITSRLGSWAWRLMTLS